MKEGRDNPHTEEEESCPKIVGAKTSCEVRQRVSVNAHRGIVLNERVGFIH